MLTADGYPPTKEQHDEAVARTGRNFTDDPIGAHRRPNSRIEAYRPKDSDILRRANEPVEGERTPEEAARLRALKALRKVAR